MDKRSDREIRGQIYGHDGIIALRVAPRALGSSIGGLAYPGVR